MIMLVDTSVWIDYFRGKDSAEVNRLSSALSEDEDLCICGLVLTEILQGIRSATQYRRVRRMLNPLIYLPMSKQDHVAAADIYRTARAGGRTIRNSLDCLIAACAISHGVPLLQNDRDFQTIAAVSKLRFVSV